MNGSDGRLGPGVVGALILGTLFIAALSTGLSWYHTVKIERELEQTVAAALLDAGFEDVRFTVKGREVTLIGTVEARLDRARMADVAASVAGVEAVRDERTVTNYASGRDFALHSYAGITTVEGELPDIVDVEMVIAAIRQQYGADPLGADLSVNRAVRRPPWLDDLDVILDTAGQVSPLTIEYTLDTMVISGEVKDRETRDRVNQAIADILADSAKLEIHLRLPSQVKEPELRIEYKRGRVSVSGTVPEDEFTEQLIAALSLAFGVDTVDNELDVDPDVRHSSWLEGVLRVVFPLAMTQWMDLQITPGEIIVRGSVNDDDEATILGDQLRENFEYARRIVNMIRVKGASG